MATRQQGASHRFSRIDSVIDRINVRWMILAYAIIVTLYVYTPTISLIVFSFNEGGMFPPFEGVTSEWYRILWANEEMRAAIGRSIQLGLVVTVISTVLATLTALAYRYEFFGKRWILYLLLMGIIVPGVTYGVGAMLFFNRFLGLSRSLWLAVPVHVVWVVPFAVIVLLAGIPPHLTRNEEAALVLGANRITVFREVILPQIAPAVLGAAVFAFTLSYNEGTRGLLLVGEGTTVPLQIFSVASVERISPDLFALGAATTVFSTVLLIVAAFLVLYGRRLAN